MKDQINVAAIGCGLFAKFMHLPNMEENSKYKLYAACDIVEEAAKEMAEKYKMAYATTDYDKVLQDKEVDLVLITTRHNLHAEQTIKAAKAGKHILCEKPMALNLDDCHQIMKEVKKSGVIPFFPAGQTQKITAPSRISKGLVTVAWPTEDIWNIKRTRALTVLGSVLSERLRIRIRETLGASYSPMAFNQSSKIYPEYGVLKALIYADPKKVGLIEREVKKIASDLSENGVDDDELQRALEPVLVRIKDLRRQNNYWLDMTLTASQRYPQQLEWNRTIMSDYRSITREYLSSLAKKYLDPSKAAVLVIVNSLDDDS